MTAELAHCGQAVRESHDQAATFCDAANGSASYFTPAGLAGTGALGAAAGGDSAAATGAAGADDPMPTEIPNSRHCPFTGAKARSKLTSLGTEGKNPVIRTPRRRIDLKSRRADVA
jgi:hypothetical protein